MGEGGSDGSEAPNRGIVALLMLLEIYISPEVDQRCNQWIPLTRRWVQWVLFNHQYLQALKQTMRLFWWLAQVSSQLCSEQRPVLSNFWCILWIQTAFSLLFHFVVFSFLETSWSVGTVSSKRCRTWPKADSAIVRAFSLSGASTSSPVSFFALARLRIHVFVPKVWP